jgi:hypothetical protein
MTPTLAPVIDMFRPNDEVRLLFRHGDVRSGTRRRVAEVHSKEIVMAELD